MFFAISSKLGTKFSVIADDILASTSIHGFWIGYEKVSGEWKWLDGSTSNFSLLSKDKSGGKHVMVNKKGIWTLANEDSCAESICIIKGSLFIILMTDLKSLKTVIN